MNGAVTNPVLTCIQERASVRSFQNQPLSREEEEAVLNAAMRAPTAANMQLYSIIVVRDAAVKATLAETCNHQPWLATAPFMLIFCADYQRLYDYYGACGVEEKCRELGEPFIKPGEQYLLLATCDAMIAAQNAVLAAQSMGIGSCYVGHIMDHYEEHARLLELPEYVFPVTLLAMGYPKAERKTQTPRLDPEYIVSQDCYHRLKPQELLDCYRSDPQPPEGNRFHAENAGQYRYLKRHTGASCYWEGIRSLRAALRHWDYRQDPEARHCTRGRL